MRLRRTSWIASCAIAGVLVSCDDLPRPHLEPPGPKWPTASQLATEGALIVLRVEGLRPVVRVLGGRSHQEDSLDSIETQVAQAVALLSPEQAGDDDRRRAAAVAIEFASLKFDAVAADVQAAQRGIRLVVRRNANDVV